MTGVSWALSVAGLLSALVCLISALVQHDWFAAMGWGAAICWLVAAGIYEFAWTQEKRAALR